MAAGSLAQLFSSADDHAGEEHQGLGEDDRSMTPPWRRRRGRYWRLPAVDAAAARVLGLVDGDAMLGLG